jgi:hypothetical protein
MASPRTRSVLKDLRIREDNNVRVEDKFLFFILFYFLILELF